ncbi:MAG: stage 0 sporulation protein, partial [Clostridia bacterium]|nr:stage 0 sporulation protein [Clostridia bacterium]
MPIVVGVKFNNNSKVYTFDAAGEEYEEGDLVVVDTQKGNELGSVAKANYVVDESALPGELKKVVRKANGRDLDLCKKAKETEPKALEI